MFAVIKAAGKQYVAVPGQKIKFDKAFGKKGDDIVFDQVLLIADGKDITLGTPTLTDARVVGKVVREGRDRKIITLKYKPKKRYKTKRGHRQPFSEVEIVGIETKKKEAKPKAAAEKKKTVKKKVSAAK